MSFFDDDEPTRPRQARRPGRAAAAGAGRRRAAPPAARPTTAAHAASSSRVAALGVARPDPARPRRQGLPRQRAKSALKDYNRDVTLDRRRLQRHGLQAALRRSSSGGAASDVTVEPSRSTGARRRRGRRQAGQGPRRPRRRDAAQRNLLDARHEPALATASSASPTLRPRGLSGQPERGAGDPRSPARCRRSWPPTSSTRSAWRRCICDALDEHRRPTARRSPARAFLPTPGGSTPTGRASKLDPAAARADAREQVAKPGTHGHGIIGTTAGDVTLQPGGAITRARQAPTAGLQMTLLRTRARTTRTTSRSAARTPAGRGRSPPTTAPQPDHGRCAEPPSRSTCRRCPAEGHADDDAVERQAGRRARRRPTTTPRPKHGPLQCSVRRGAFRAARLVTRRELNQGARA